MKKRILGEKKRYQFLTKNNKESVVSVFLFFLLVTVHWPLVTVSNATNLPLRGIARGEPKLKVGEKAPLDIPELKDAMPELEKAQGDGKVIALMLGYPSHCPWCDRMDRYIRNVMDKTKNFDSRAVFIMVQVEHAKLIPPPKEGIKLKEAFGTEGQPWLFLIDKEGTVRYIYKMFVSGDKFERSIYEILGEKKNVPVFDKE